MLQKIQIPIEDANLKIDGKKDGHFTGYASVFNKVDSYRDTIMPGAYSETIKQARKPSMFINHNSFDIPVGDWIKLKEDKTGLLVEGLIDMNHRDGPTAYSALKRGAMDGLSIGFRIPEGGAEERDDGLRVISKIDLKEISIVNFPADAHARISVVKSDIESVNSLRDVEQILRDSGYSKSAAIAFVSRIKELVRCDTETHFKDEIAKHNEKHQTDALLNLINSLKLEV